MNDIKNLVQAGVLRPKKADEFTAKLLSLRPKDSAYDGGRRKRLREALLSSFPKRKQLAMLLDDALSRNLNEISDTGDFAADTHEVTVSFRSDLKALRLFLEEAIKQRPNATDLKALYSELFG